MKDIDFDELDRAVSSVLTNKVAATPEPPRAEAVSRPATNTIPPSAPSAATHEVSQLSSRPTISRPPSPAMRRGGRFMDVVHPSSEMKTASTPAPRVVRRPLSPISDDMKASAPANAASSVKADEEKVVVSGQQASVSAVPDLNQSLGVPSVSSVSETTDVISEPYPTLDTLPADSTPRIDTASSVQEVEAEPDTTAWPDPLEVDGPAKASQDSSEDISPDESAETVKDELDADAVPAAPPAPLGEQGQSPFLADTKVEKRPLGAFADGGNDTTADLGSAGLQLASSGPVVSPQLEADLAEIEASDTSDKPIAKPEAATLAPPLALGAAGSAPQITSIPQQYVASNTASDPSTQSVFDTSAYHQPLLPPKTQGKSHTWIWVLLIIGLLVVGAGLGALFFMAGF